MSMTVLGEGGDNLTGKQQEAWVHIQEIFAGITTQVMEEAGKPIVVSPDGGAKNHIDDVIDNPSIRIAGRVSIRPK